MKPHLETGSHTPGPWALDGSELDVICGAVTDGGNIVCIAPEGWTRSMARWEANARLIAAAPELLEALREVSKEIDTDAYEPLSHECIAIVRAAIAKATGAA